MPEILVNMNIPKEMIEEATMAKIEALEFELKIAKDSLSCSNARIVVLDQRIATIVTALTEEDITHIKDAAEQLIRAMGEKLAITKSKY